MAGDQFLILHLGDGVVGYVKDGRAQVATGPDNSEFANQTSFLTTKGSASAMRILRGSGSLAGVDGFILMSDGTAHSLYDSRWPPGTIAQSAFLRGRPGRHAGMPG